MNENRSILERLPLELLRCICQHLPISSAAALSISNKYLLVSLGRGYLGELHGEYADKPQARRFLQLISRDLSTQWACLDCLRLHTYHWAKPAARKRPRHPPLFDWTKSFCEQADMHYELETVPLPVPESECRDLQILNGCCLEGIDDDAEERLFSGRKDISWTVLNNIMRAYAAGCDVSAQLADLSTSHSSGLPFTTMQFRISKAGQLLMCETRRLGGGHSLLEDVFICPDISTSLQYHQRENNSDSLLYPILHCASSHLTPAEQRSCAFCSVLTSCDLCATEFTIARCDEEATEHVRAGMAEVLITRWLNLGDMSDPFEPFWRCHLRHRALAYSKLDGAPESLVHWRHGSIVAEWEESVKIVESVEMGRKEVSFTNAAVAERAD